MNLRNLPRLYRTLKPLRRSQLAWRAWYALLRKAGLGNRISAPASVGILPLTWIAAVPLFHGCDPLATFSTLQRGEFTILNETRTLKTETIDWRLSPQNTGRLWTLTLHYHAWLYDLAMVASGTGPEASRAAELFQRYLSDWLATCDLDVPGARGLAWHAFAIATRIGWWIRAYDRLGTERFKAFGKLHMQFVESLWKQAQFLSEHVEWDLRGNHLIRDAVGLAWAGRFFDGPDARHWRQLACEIALSQSAEQILPDGGHFERSPMYHVHVMEDLATLALLLDDNVARAELLATLARMSEYLQWMRHPDGRVPLFNDGGFNGAPSPDEMLAHCSWLDRVAGESAIPGVLKRNEDSGEPKAELNFTASARGARYFADSGVAVFHGERFSVFFDAGEVAVRYQPAHAHADTLTLECSFDGARLFVDPGTFDYDPGERRHYDRSTAAHNTVCIDGADSSEMWHIFRVGRRAMPAITDLSLNPGLRITASHDGYSHLSDAPLHTRRVTAGNGEPLTVIDTITGDGSGRNHHLQAGWLIAPEWRPQPSDDGWTLTRRDDASSKVRVRITSDASPAIVLSLNEAPYHPEYGLEFRTFRLSWNWTGKLPMTVTVTVTTVVTPE